MFEGLMQPTHLILILVILLVVFGPSKLAGLGHTLGTTVREFRGAVGTMTEVPNPTAPTPVAPVTPVAETGPIMLPETTTTTVRE